ncbi:MAG: Ig-like domain repeat protein [Terracidiphilus sp.]|jgi:hypothetical protein
MRIPWSGGIAYRLAKFTTGIPARFLGKLRARLGFTALLSVTLLASHSQFAAATSNRSTFIELGPTQEPWLNTIAVDSAHQQVFTAFGDLGRIDVRSTVDYHLIRSILTPSPQTLDISPDNSTIAVGNSAATITFYSTITYAQTSQFVLPEMGYGIIGLVYTANSDLMMIGLDANENGITAYWNHSSNSLQYYSGAPNWPNGPYLLSNSPIPAQIGRSADYKRVIIAATDETSVQIVDGTSGNPLYTYDSGGMVTYAATASGSTRYAICASTDSGYAPNLHILDGSFNEIYTGPFATTQLCYGMTFSADGQTLYGEMTINGSISLAAMDMTSFQITSVPSYDGQAGVSNGTWQVADSTGLLFGFYANDASGQTVWGVLDTTATAPPTLTVNPSVQPVQLVSIINNVGSPQGNDTITLFCQGLGGLSASQVQVTIGGQTATVTSLSNYEGSSSSSEAFQWVTVKTPAGSPGAVDVTLQASGTTSTLSKPFTYAQSRTIYPFSTQPSFLLFDSYRNLLYAAHGKQVEVIDPIAQKVLTPLVPASGSLATSNFGGISLSPDGNRLWIADVGANLIHMISLQSGVSGYTINPTTAIGSSATVTPLRVFELSNGQLLGTSSTCGQQANVTSGGSLFQINPGAQSGNCVLYPGNSPYGGDTLDAFAWNTTNGGNNALLTYAQTGLGLGSNAIWNVGTGLVQPYLDSATASWVSNLNQSNFFEEAANEDGTVVGGPGGCIGPCQAVGYGFKDINLNLLGIVSEPNSGLIANMGVGGENLTGAEFHPSGALFYEARNSATGLVDIVDTHLEQSIALVALPELLPQTPIGPLGSYVTGLASYGQHILAVDPTGHYLFAVTASGITEMVLNSIPLSIGNIQPAFVQAPGKQAFTIRGAGFEAGAVVSFGGVAAPTTYVDGNTLTATPGTLSAGWTDITVTLPGGTAYTATALLHVIAQITTPVITGSSPASVILATVGSVIGDLADGLTVTLEGTGFDISDQVTVNGLPAFSGFVDSGHIQANYPASYAFQTGNLDFTVTSPYTGASNTYQVPVVNPVPVIQQTIPASLPLNGPDITVKVMGTGLVNGPTAVFNGQNVQASYQGEWDDVVIPASMLQTAGMGTLIITNPGPGGGASNAFSIQVSANAPLAKVQLTASAMSVPANESDTLTVTVTGNQAGPTGQIVLMDGSIMVNGLTLPASDTYTFTVYGLTPGQHNFSAIYAGDTTYAPATSATVTVNVVAVATPTVQVTPSASSISTSQALTITVSVSGGQGAATPTGTVALFGAYNSSSVALGGGVATIAVPAGSLAVGNDTLYASYTPDANSAFTYGPSDGSASVTVTAPSKTTPAVTVTPASSSIATAQSLSVTVTISGSSTTPTGTVTLSGGGYTSSATALSSGSATITIPAGSLAIGSDTLTATYMPDTNSSSTYNGATGSTSVAVTAAPSFGPPSGFQPGSISILPGATSGNTTAISVVGSNGFSGTLSLTCSITPAAASDPPTCTLTPSSLTLSGTTAQSSTLTVYSTAASSAANRTPDLFWPRTGGVALAFAFLLITPRQRRNWLAVLALLAVVASIGVFGCGGGGSSGSGGGGGGGGNTGTTPGAYTVTVTGTSGATTVTIAAVSLTVQ